MSFWQLGACVDGYNSANGGGEKIEPPSDAEFEQMLRNHGLPLH